MCTVLEALKSKTMLLVDLVTSESLLFTSTLLPSGCVPPRREGSHISAVVPFVRAEPHDCVVSQGPQSRCPCTGVRSWYVNFGVTQISGHHKVLIYRSGQCLLALG